MSTGLVILGCGYIGTRLARTALAQGRKVRVTTRRISKLADLVPLGIEVVACEASKPKQFGPAIQGMTGATVVYAIPPVNELPAGEAVRRAAQAALGVGARAFLYLGSAGLYGHTASDEWVDEETPLAHDDPAMASYHAEEAAVQAALAAGLRTVTLRLSPVYGSGRGVRTRMRKGEYKIVDGGDHWISRIHVDDLIRILVAAEERAPAGATYLVGDDSPTLQREVAEWLSQRLGLPAPRSVPSVAPGEPRQSLRSRRIRNDRLKRDLGLTLLYPSFREGELQIEQEEKGQWPDPVDAGAPVAPPSSGAESRRLRLDDLPASGAIRVERVAPGGQLAIAAPGARLVHVLSGNLSLLEGDRALALSAGDLLDRPGAIAIRNDGAAEARLLVVDVDAR